MNSKRRGEIAKTKFSHNTAALDHVVVVWSHVPELRLLAWRKINATAFHSRRELASFAICSTVRATSWGRTRA